MKKIRVLFAAFFCFSLLLTAGEKKEPLWKIQLGSQISGSPAVFANKAIVATRNGSLSALDRSGQTVWKQKLPSGCLAAPAVDANGDIYVACVDGSLLRFASSGKQVWQTELKQDVLTSPLLAAETLFTVSGSGRVWRIAKKDGAVQKTIDLGLAAHSSRSGTPAEKPAGPGQGFPPVRPRPGAAYSLEIQDRRRQSVGPGRQPEK